MTHPLARGRGRNATGRPCALTWLDGLSALRPELPLVHVHQQQAILQVNGGHGDAAAGALGVCAVCGGGRQGRALGGNWCVRAPPKALPCLPVASTVIARAGKRGSWPAPRVLASKIAEWPLPCSRSGRRQQRPLAMCRQQGPPAAREPVGEAGVLFLRGSLRYLLGGLLACPVGAQGT